MRRRCAAGFTLAEIMIAVVIIGLLAAMAIPSFISIQERSLHFRFMNDVRIFRDAIQTYYLETGTLPTDSSTGVLGADLTGYIHPDRFGEPTSIGGRWDVEANDSGVTLAVGVVDYNLTRAQLQRLDARFDDGDLATGQLRDIVPGSRYYFIIE